MVTITAVLASIFVTMRVESSRAGSDRSRRQLTAVRAHRRRTSEARFC